MDDPSGLTALTSAAAALRGAEADLDAAVIAARARGHSWAQIGAAIGITRQSAHERWGHLSRGGCRSRDCDCPAHQAGGCPCGHGNTARAKPTS